MDVGVRGRFTVNSVGMIRALAVNHQGIALLPERIVADDLASGKLQRILPEWEGSPVSIYAVTETRLIPAKTADGRVGAPTREPADRLINDRLEPT